MLFVVCVLAGVLASCGVATAASCEINGGAKYTNDPVVRVSYSPGWADKVFRISSSSWFGYSDEWYEIPVWDRSVDFEFLSYSGDHTVYMQFASSPDSVFKTTCSDSIILDVDPPYVDSYSVKVKRGKVCYLPVWMGDNYSKKCQDTVRITTKRGVVKKKFVDIYQKTGRFWYWRYRCKLPVGTYRIKVSARDLAGNVSKERTGGWLKVVR